MRSKYFLVCVDRTIFGQNFWLKNREGKVDVVYGRNTITPEVSQAKTYIKLGNAMNMANKIRDEIGNSPQIQVHSWTPKDKLGLTTLVKVVQ